MLLTMSNITTQSIKYNIVTALDNNVGTITTQSIKYNIVTALNLDAGTVTQFPFTLPFTMPGLAVANDIIYNILTTVLKYNITTEITEPQRIGIQYMIIETSFIIA